MMSRYKLGLPIPAHANFGSTHKNDTSRRDWRVSVVHDLTSTDELTVSAWSLNASSSYVEGQTVVLACQSDGHGHVRLEWIKDGQPVSTGDDGSTLRLDHVTSTDAGQYVCVATRDHESITSNVISVSVTGQLRLRRSAMLSYQGRRNVIRTGEARCIDVRRTAKGCATG